MAKWQKKAIWLCLIAAITLFSGCSTSQPSKNADNTANSSGTRIVAISEQLVGAPYRYGGESPRGFDCSGLVRYVYRQVGIVVPHSSHQLQKQARKVHLNDIEPGDLLFFKISRNKVSHVGIYTSAGNFIHAPSSGKQVSVANLNDRYWKNRLVAAGRLL